MAAPTVRSEAPRTFRGGRLFRRGAGRAGLFEQFADGDVELGVAISERLADGSHDFDIDRSRVALNVRAIVRRDLHARRRTAQFAQGHREMI